MISCDKGNGHKWIPMLALFLCGCIGNKQIVDTTYTYKKAIVKMPDGEAKEIELSSWADYENSDAISIVGENGEHIYAHLNNVVLIGDQLKEGEKEEKQTYVEH